MATHSSVVACEIPWTEETGGLHTVNGVTKRQTRLTTKQQDYMCVCVCVCLFTYVCVYIYVYILFKRFFLQFQSFTYPSEDMGPG